MRSTFRCSVPSKDDVFACFRSGGGVPYARFERFHEVMAEDSGQTVLPALKNHILPLVPGLDERLKDGIRVLDVGCGRGRALNLLATWFPNSRFVGIDLSEEAVKFAGVEAKERGNENASFIARDLSRFDQQAQPATFDFITTFDAVHDQASPAPGARACRRSQLSCRGRCVELGRLCKMTGGLQRMSAVYGLNGQRAHYVRSLFKVSYESIIQISRNFHALFTKTLENSDTLRLIRASVSYTREPMKPESRTANSA